MIPIVGAKIGLLLLVIFAIVVIWVIFVFGILGLLTAIFLPRLLLALVFAFFGFLFLFNKIPLPGYWNYIMAFVMWVLAYVVGTGVISGI